MLRIAITAWIAGGSSFLFLPELPEQGLGVSIAISAIFAMLAYQFRKSHQTIHLFLIVLTFYFFGWSHHFYFASERLARPFPSSLENQEIKVQGYVDQLPSGNTESQRFSFRVNQWYLDDQHNLPDRIYLSWSSGWSNKKRVPELVPGQTWEFVVKLKRPHTLFNQHGFDFERWMFHQGMGAHGSVRSAKKIADSGFIDIKTAVEYQRWRIRNKIKEALPKNSPYVGVLIALVIGDQNAIPQEDWKVFNATGVGHLISISGLHVTMLSGVGAMVAAYLWRRRDWPLIIPVQKVAACAGLLTAFLYAWLAGFQIPAQRTLYMVGVVAFALWTSRIARPFDIWWIALFLVLLIDPMAPYTPGFWLSFGAVAVILYGMGASSSLIGIPNGNEWERDRLGRFVQALKESCRLQWIVTIALLPCTLFWFYQVSVVSPIANALAIPVISFMVTPLAIGGALLPELFAPFLLKLSHDVIELTAHYLNWLANFDGAVVWSHQPSYWAIALSVLGIYLHVQPGLIRNHLASRILGLLLILPIFWSHPSVIHHGEYRVNVFDIGQGTAVLVETRNHRLLYDAGPLQGRKDNAGERVLLPYFRGEGITQLDRLVISHQDSDHIGGATSLMQAIQIQSFLGTIPMTHSLFHEIRQRDIPALPCQYGQEWIWDGIHFKVWHPSEELTFEQRTHRRKPNENSCVLEVRNSVASFWLTGDIEKQGEHEHAQRIQAINYQGPDEVILMAPHHGSKTSSSKNWLETLKPTIAFAQYGYLNRYGHPHKNIRDRYHELEIPFLGTSTTGGQIWNVSNQELHVELLRQTRKRLWHDH